jgi:hypothetical protein
MTKHPSLTCLAVLLALAPSLCKAQTATPGFTISASNVTMPSSGTTSIPFTLISVNKFAGSLVVGVTPPTPAAGVRLPYLEIGGPAESYPLTANATLTGTIGILTAVPVPVPVRFNLPAHPAPGKRVIWSLAAVLMLGFGLSRRKARATRLLLALCTLIALTGISACGGPPTLTPGTYTYTLTASTIDASQPQLSASTQITLTVPPGIVTK